MIGNRGVIVVVDTLGPGDAPHSPAENDASLLYETRNPRYLWTQPPTTSANLLLRCYGAVRETSIIAKRQ